MKKFLLAIICLLSFSSYATFSETVSKVKDALDDWGVYIDTNLTAGSNGVNFTPTVFIPIRPSDKDVVIIDLRGRVGMDTPIGNLAVGYRRKLSDAIAVGVNTGIDVIATDNANVLSQANFGIEFFSKYIDVAMNFYAPIGKGKEVEGTAITPFARIEDNELKLVYSDNTLETTRYGIDLILQGQFPIQENAVLKLTGGIAYFFGSEYYDAVFSAEMDAVIEAQFDLFGADATFYTGPTIGYDSQDGLKVALNFGISIKIGGKARESDGRGDYVYNDAQGFKKSEASVATVAAENRLHIEDATTVIDGNEYHYLYEGDANTDIVSMIEGSEENALVVLNGDSGEINITQDIELKDGQYVIGEGRAIVVTGPSGRQAILLIGGSRATVHQQTASENIFTLAANNTLDSINLVGGQNAVFVDASNDAKLINIDAQTGVKADGAGTITIKDAVISSIESNDTEKVVISGSEIGTIDSSNDDEYQISDSTVTGATVIQAEKTTISDSTFGASFQLIGGNKETQILNTSFADTVTIDSMGNIVLNGVNISGDACLTSYAGSISLDGLTLESDLIVSAKYAVEVLNTSISGDASILSEQDQILLQALTVGGDLTVDAATILAYQVTVGGDLYVLNAQNVEFVDVNANSTTFNTDAQGTIDGTTIVWDDTDGDGVTDHLDICPNDVNSVPIAYYVDNDLDGIGYGPSLGDRCPSDIGSGYADNTGDIDDNDSDNDGIPNNIDSDDWTPAPQVIRQDYDITYSTSGHPSYTSYFAISSQAGSISGNFYMSSINSNPYYMTSSTNNYVNPNYYRVRIEIMNGCFDTTTLVLAKLSDNGLISMLPSSGYDYIYDMSDGDYHESCGLAGENYLLYGRISVILEKI